MRKKRIKRRVHKDVEHDGYSGFYANQNPWHSVDQNENGARDMQYDSRKLNDQPLGLYPAPTDKGWLNGFQMQTTYAIKHGLPLTSTDAMVVEAARRGIPLHALAQEETSVSLPVSHITKDLHEMVSFMKDDIEALEKAGVDVAKAKDLLTQFESAIPS